MTLLRWVYNSASSTATPKWYTPTCESKHTNIYADQVNKFQYLPIFLTLLFSWVECLFLLFDLGVLSLDARLACADAFLDLNVLVTVVGSTGSGILLKLSNDSSSNWRLLLLVSNWFLWLLFVVFFTDTAHPVLRNGFSTSPSWSYNHGVLLFSTSSSGCFWFLTNENKFLYITMIYFYIYWKLQI